MSSKSGRRIGNNPHLLSRSRRNRGLDSGAVPRQQRIAPRWPIIVVVLLLVIAGLTGLLKRSGPHQSVSKTSALQSDTTPDLQQAEIPLTPPEPDPELEIIDEHEADSGGLPEAAITAFGPPDPFSQVDFSLRRGDTLFQALLDNGIARDQANLVVAAVGKEYDLRLVRPGQGVQIRLFGERIVIEASFMLTTLDHIAVRYQSGTLVAERVKLDPIRRVHGNQIRVSGSLYESFEKAGLPYSLLIQIANLFAWSIDFTHDVHPEDIVEILWEELFIGDRSLGPGRILAARYKGSSVQRSLYWFPGEQQDDWYHGDGINVQADFLRSPVKFGRISSTFSLSRLHPVLGVKRPHRGVDFAAAVGTLVMAVADGTVISAGWSGGAGRAVRVRHRNGWITSYSHLSTISVRVGQRVRQKQILGKVGSSGLSTGPHLDYRVKIGGNFVDPLRIKLPAGKIVAAADRGRFSQQRTELDNQLDAFVDKNMQINSTAMQKQPEVDTTSLNTVH